MSNVIESPMKVKMQFLAKVVMNMIGIDVKDEVINVNVVDMLVKIKVKPGCHVEIEYDYTLMHFPFFAVVSSGGYSDFNIKSFYSKFDMGMNEIMEEKAEILKALSKMDISVA